MFGHAEQPDAAGGVHDIVYINWLLMARAGLTGLEFYTPETGGWRQAHMQARYVGSYTCTPPMRQSVCHQTYIEISRDFLPTVPETRHTAVPDQHPHMAPHVCTSISPVSHTDAATDFFRLFSYVILKVLLEAGNGLVEIRRVTGADGNPDLQVYLDREKISTFGREAIGRFLLALQTHKSLGDVSAGTAMYVVLRSFFLQDHSVCSWHGSVLESTNVHSIVFNSFSSASV